MHETSLAVRKFVIVGAMLHVVLRLMWRTRHRLSLEARTPRLSARGDKK